MDVRYPGVASMASTARIGAFGDWRGFWIRTIGDVVIEQDGSRYFDEGIGPRRR